MDITVEFKAHITSHDDSSLYPTTKEEYDAIEELVELVKLMKDLGD